LPGEAGVLGLHFYGPFFRCNLGQDLVRDAPPAQEDSGKRGDEVCVGGKGGTEGEKGGR